MVGSRGGRVKGWWGQGSGWDWGGGGEGSRDGGGQRVVGSRGARGQLGGGCRV